MRRSSIAILAALVLAAAAGCRCDGGPSDPDRAGAPDAPLAEEPAAPQDATPETAAPAPAASERAPGGEPDAPLRWDFQPATLDVYRDTRVVFRVEEPETPPATWQLEWTFDDGSPPAYGPRVEHVFRGGQSDQAATLTVRDGDRTVYVGTRDVRLERLPIAPLGEAEGETDFAADLSVPPPPEPGDTSFRFVVISDSNGPYGTVPQGPHVAAAIARITDALHPDLVVHDGDMVAGQRPDLSAERLERMWEAYHDAVTRPLLLAGIPLAPAAGNHDASPNIPQERRMFEQQWKRQAFIPDVTFVDDKDYPFRYSFTHKGALFVVMDGAIGRVDEAQIRWLRAQLRDARIYTARYVFSHVPLHKFTDVRYGDLALPEEAHDRLRESASEDEVESYGLEKHFRLYNLFLENNVTMLFSGHYEVYFKGRYGALRVVSTGNIAGVRRALSGTGAPQGPSFVVVDVENGRPKHVFALRGPDYTKRFDESTLPTEVEVYRYDPTYTPGTPDVALPAGIIE